MLDCVMYFHLKANNVDYVLEKAEQQTLQGLLFDCWAVKETGCLL